MGLRINTNVLSMNAQRNLQITTKSLSRSLERLSSGSRINRAADDPAGLAISEGLTSQMRGLRQAIRNANDSNGFLNTAEGALAEMTTLAQRLRELAIQAANGAIGNKERSFLNDEVEAILEEMSRISSQTEFNGTKLLDGSFQETDLQVGINKGEVIRFTIGDARTSQLGALAIKSGAQNYLTGTGSGLTIGGRAITVSADYDNVSTNGNSWSALAISKAINAEAGITEVQATVLETIVELNNLKFSKFNGNITDQQLVINDQAILGAIDNSSEFISLINDYSSLTGVRARFAESSTTDIELYAMDGRNIEILISGASMTASKFNKVFSGVMSENRKIAASQQNLLFSTGATNAASGLSLRTFSGAVELRSASAIIIGGTNTSQALGFAGSGVSVDDDNAVFSVDVSTQDEAQRALSIIDATIGELNNLRSNLGAVQNRLDSTVRNVGVLLENISAAQSQVKDADLALETAELTRAQIQQQAGIVVLGQANSSIQVALNLLNF